MDVCANFLVNSNHKDALRKTANDRRWCILFCAQQSHEDLLQSGMGGTYFPRLYDWLRNGGYAHVTELLRSYKIPQEFGLDCLLSRAPETSSTDEAILAGMGRVEQEVLEAIHSETRGFKGGWVSSMALDELLKEHRLDAVMPRARRREMMRTLGYDWHPSLRDGRTSAPMPGSTERPVLFIERDHWSLSTTDPVTIMQAYINAQMPTA